jgi:hypothetical protein
MKKILQQWTFGMEATEFLAWKANASEDKLRTGLLATNVRDRQAAAQHRQEDGFEAGGRRMRNIMNAWLAKGGSQVLQRWLQGEGLQGEW